MSKSPHSDGKALSIGVRPVRDIGGCIGSSIDLDALRDLGIVDDDGELLVDRIPARQTVRDDGTIEIDMELEEIEDQLSD